jgi:lysozyme
MRMTDPALTLSVKTIAEFEGFSGTPYQDVGGVWTQGYGQTYDLSGRPITAHAPTMTEADARTHLAVLVASYLEKVRGMVHATITDSQAAALCSLSYNIGTSALRSSSLLIALNQGRTQEAADGFRAWIYAGGHTSAGLRNRREKERALFLTPVPHEMTATQCPRCTTPAMCEAEDCRWGWTAQQATQSIRTNPQPLRMN